MGPFPHDAPPAAIASLRIELAMKLLFYSKSLRFEISPRVHGSGRQEKDVPIMGAAGGFHCEASGNVIDRGGVLSPSFARLTLLAEEAINSR